MSLNFVLLSPVSPIYSSLQLEQIKTYIRLELSQDIDVLSLNVLSTFLNLYASDSGR